MAPGALRISPSTEAKFGEDKMSCSLDILDVVSKAGNRAWLWVSWETSWFYDCIVASIIHIDLLHAEKKSRF